MYHLVSGLPLLNRSYRALYRNSIFLTEDVALLREKGLCTLPGVGQTIVKDIMSGLNKLQDEHEISWVDLVGMFFVYENMTRAQRIFLAEQKIFTVSDFNSFIDGSTGKHIPFHLWSFYYKRRAELSEKLSTLPQECPEFIAFGDSLVELLEPFIFIPAERAALISFLRDIFSLYFLRSNSMAKQLRQSVIVSSMFYKDNYLCAVMKRFFLFVLRKEGAVDNEYICEKYNLFPFPSFWGKEVSSNCLWAKEQNEGTFTVETVALMDWVSSLKEREYHFIFSRLRGISLRGVGNLWHISGERVRQCCDKILAKRPILIEDKWKDLFTSYFWDKGAFCFITGESEYTFNYLRMAYPRGKKSISLLLEDDAVPSDLKDRYREFLHRDEAFIDGEYVSNKKGNLFPKVLDKILFEQVHMKDLFHRYQEVMKEYNIPCSISNFTAFSSKINFSSDCLLSNRMLIRRYDVNKADIKTLIKEIELKDYAGELSTAILFNKYPDVMKRFDIRNEYELHNLLRKRSDDIDLPVSFGRMPTIYIGNFDRKEQLVALLKECGKIKSSQFARKYCKKYGMSIPVFFSNYAKLLRKYKTPGGYYVYRDDKETLSEEEIKRIQGALQAEIYSEQGLHRIVTSVVGEEKAGLFDCELLYQAGYFQLRKIILRRDFKSLSDGFDSYFKSNVNFFERSLDNLFSVRPYLRKRAKEYSLFRYDEYTVVNGNWLVTHGYTKEKIQAFVDSVISFAKDNVFSIFWLKNSGFQHEWLKNKKDWGLLESFLEYSGKLYFRYRGNCILFHTSHTLPGAYTIMQDVFAREGLLSVQDMDSFLQKNYEICMNPQSLYLIQSRLKKELDL